MEHLGWLDKLLYPTNLGIIIPLWAFIGAIVGGLAEYIYDYLTNLNPAYHQDSLGTRDITHWILTFILTGIGFIASIANYYSHLLNHGLIFKAPEISGIIYAGFAFLTFYAAVFITAPILREQIVDTYNWLKRKGN